jgi:hypothetical protein
MVQTTDQNMAPKRRWTPFRATVALVLTAPLVVVLPPLAVVVACIAYWNVVPAHSASTQIADLKTNLTLRFYYTWDENTDHGRYLYINAPSGRITIAMTAFDWAHNSRTSIYLTPERKIAVLGPMGDDYLVSLDPPTTNVATGQSESWSYLGAFDFQLAESGEQRLRFVSAAEQAECIPMLGDAVKDYQARKAARERSCNHYYVPQAAK